MTREEYELIGDAQGLLEDGIPMIEELERIYDALEGSVNRAASHRPNITYFLANASRVVDELVDLREREEEGVQ